ncbi:MAG: Ni/Fe-hydrogenase cytochrome b subunit [Deferribacteraceae bacterium]|jgi:Ni/Fe-hydrogenase subunit HybB-like protein|nr:Ni/Fe-hydrogenase cytochrome b subunit [Deferribacteraceae bacterium]
MSSEHTYVKAPGKLITPTTVILALIVATGFSIIGYRLVFGLGVISNLSDGYPWGVWLAYDVAAGSAFACGGYSVAILCYIFNGWKYHPMIRSALVTSFFGYALAGLSVMVDIGRYWNAYGFMMPSRWQTNSVLFEVAVCIMGYTVVLLIEFMPSALETLRELKPNSFIKKLADFTAPKLDKVLMFFVVLGMTLPTMHQSSLGTLFVITGQQLHPLWQTNLLPLLFVSNAILLGFAVTLFESGLSAAGFKRPFEAEAFGVAKVVPIVGFFWLAVRFGDLIYRGHILTAFTPSFHMVIFWIETLLITAPIFIFLGKLNPRKLFYTALLLTLGGGMYRIDVYLVGFNPGDNWYAYFPSIPEALITFGFIALEVLAYIVLARLLRLLPAVHTAHN